MGRKAKNQTQEPSSQGDQMELMEVGPENIQEILPVAREYKSVVRQRVALTAREKDLKERIKSFAHESGLTPMADGSIRFKCDGVKVEVVPQDEKVKVTLDEESDAE